MPVTRVIAMIESDIINQALGEVMDAEERFLEMTATGETREKYEVLLQVKTLMSGAGDETKYEYVLIATVSCGEISIFRRNSMGDKMVEARQAFKHLCEQYDLSMVGDSDE